MTEPDRDFRVRLRELFDLVRKPDGTTYSYREIAARIRALGHPGPSAGYLNQLATGARRDPRMSHVVAISEAFGVPTSYFFDEEAADGESQAPTDEVRVDHQAHGAQLMALRAGELSPRGRQQVMDLLDVVYRLERSEAAERGDGDDGDDGRGDGRDDGAGATERAQT